MAIGQSQRKVDGGKIKGAQNVPSALEVRLVWEIPNGKIATAVCHGRYTAIPPDLQAVANSLYTQIGSGWSTNLAALCHVDTSLLRLEVRDMTSHLNPVIESQGAAHPGTSTDVAMPADAAIVLTEQITQRGRGLKGRMYLPGWATTADGGAGQITVAAQTACNAFGLAVFNALTAQQLQPCVAQVARQEYIGLDGASHAARNANANTFVTSYTCKDLEWDTQRRRGN